MSAKTAFKFVEKKISPQTYCRMCLLPFFSKKCKKRFHFFQDKDMLGPWGYWGPSCPCPDPPPRVSSHPAHGPRLNFSPAWGYQSLLQQHHHSAGLWSHVCLFLMGSHCRDPALACHSPEVSGLLKNLVTGPQLCPLCSCPAGWWLSGWAWPALGFPRHLAPQPKGAAGSHCSLTRHEDEF